jgi:hypothetical protein
MAKYFDEQKWSEAIRHDDWYLCLADDYKKLTKKAEESSKKVSGEIKEEIYQFFENRLAKKEIALGKDGPNWDAERKPIDTIVIHHTKNQPGITWQRLSAMHLIRLYAIYYSNPVENEKHVKGKPIFSHHLRNGEQVFYAYHWLVRMSGEIERLLPDNEVGWQAGNWEVNCRSVAICLDNDFENSRPSKEAISMIAKIIKENYNKVEKARIFGHREINPKTTCPGNPFLSGWKQEVLDLI